jgi:membrane associated rhomboid family serine protease
MPAGITSSKYVVPRRLGAYFVLYPNSRVLTLVLWLPIRIPAWFAFFAHVGGFIFGVIAAWVLVSTGRIAAQENTSNAT